MKRHTVKIQPMEGRLRQYTVQLDEVPLQGVREINLTMHCKGLPVVRLEFIPGMVDVEVVDAQLALVRHSELSREELLAGHMDVTTFEDVAERVAKIPGDLARRLVYQIYRVWAASVRFGRLLRLFRKQRRPIDTTVTGGTIYDSPEDLP